MSELTSGNLFGFLLTDTSRLFRQTFEKMTAENGVGLTPGEIRALGYVIRFKGARQTVLAEHMGVEPMTLSAYLDRLEARGLIERRVDPGDRRAKLIEPTENAMRVMLELDPIFQQLYEQVSCGLDKAQMEVLAAGLRTIRANLTTDPRITAPFTLVPAQVEATQAS